jgi:hypothetical protein
MSLHVIPVVTNPAQDHAPHTAAQDHAGENSTENGEEMSENSSSFTAAEEDNESSGSEAD